MSHLVSKVAEHAVIFSEEGNILILETTPFEEDGKTRWTFAGGRLETNDKPVEGLKREIREETGMCNVKVLIPFHTSRWGHDDPQKYAVLYIVTVAGEPQLDLNVEHTNYKWIKPEDANNYNFINEYFAKAIPLAVEYLHKLTN